MCNSGKHFSEPEIEKCLFENLKRDSKCFYIFLCIILEGKKKQLKIPFSMIIMNASLQFFAKRHITNCREIYFFIFTSILNIIYWRGELIDMLWLTGSHLKIVKNQKCWIWVFRTRKLAKHWSVIICFHFSCYFPILTSLILRLPFDFMLIYSTKNYYYYCQTTFLISLSDCKIKWNMYEIPSMWHSVEHKTDTFLASHFICKCKVNVSARDISPTYCSQFSTFVLIPASSHSQEKHREN